MAISLGAIILLAIVLIAFVCALKPAASVVPLSKFAPSGNLYIGADIVAACLSSPLPAACGPAVAGYGTSYSTGYFNRNPAFLFPISIGGPSACTEIALLDTSRWPAIAFSVDLLWNHAKDGSPTSLSSVASRLGTYAAPITDASGKKTSYNTTLYSIPALQLYANDGTLRPFGTTQQPLLPPSLLNRAYQGPLAMTGELDDAHPRAIITYNAVANYALVLSYASRQMGLTAVGSYLDISAAFGNSQIEAPLYSAQSLAGPAFESTGALYPPPPQYTVQDPPYAGGPLSPPWGFFVYLTVSTGAGSAGGWFLVDTGAIGVTMIVTSAFAANLACYSPLQTLMATSATGASCYALQRICINVFGAASPICLPVMVGPDIVKAPGAAGSIGMALLQYLDVFTAHAGDVVASAVQVNSQYANSNWSAVECSQLAGSMTGASCSVPTRACASTVSIRALGCAHTRA
jgi:hypothetical protein